MIHTVGLSPSLDVTYLVGGVALGEIHRPRSVLRLAGGKSLNASRALVRLGHRVRAIAPLGGRIGDLVAELLTPTGIELVRLDSTAETRMCVSVADEGAATLTEFYEHAAPADGSELDRLAHALVAVEAGEWLALSGSIPADIDLDRLTGLLADCSTRGVRLAVDTHGPVLGMLLDRAAPAVVKINRSEAAELAGGDAADVLERGEALRRRGAEILVITDGAAGAYGWSSDGAWRVRTEDQSGQSGAYPVGSGDCFLAGLVADLAAGVTLPEAMRTAAAVGAANAQTPGGALFDPATVATLRSLTKIRRLPS